MSSVESDFADHPGDGPPGAFIVWIVPVFWPFLLIRILLSIIERRPFPQTPKGPTPKTSREHSPQTSPSGGGPQPYLPFPRSA
jgi:hypothetical protein